MYLKNRTKNILRYLIKQSDFLNVKNISDKFSVSVRTVRYDLEDLDYFLKSYSLKIDKFPNKGVRLNASHEAKSQILKDIDSSSTVESVLTHQQQVQYILHRLLVSDFPITLQTLSEELFLGKSTISKALNEAGVWLSDRNIKLIKKTNYGLKIECDEQAWRKSAAELLSKGIDKDYMMKLLNRVTENILISDKQMDFVSSQYFNMIFVGIDTKLLGNIINELEESLHIKIVDSSFTALMVHLALAIKRLRSHRCIRMNQKNLDELMDKKEFYIAKKIIKKYEKQLGVVIEDDEVGYVTLHILASKKRIGNLDDQEYKNVLWMTQQLIDCVESQIGLKINRDEQLVKGIMLHLEPAIVRLSNKMYIKNPILGDIKSRYHHLFEAVRIACIKILAQDERFEIPDDEIAYLTLHLGAAIERQAKKVSVGVNVMLVCSSGVGTVKMLSSRIKYEFPTLNIRKEVSILDISEDDLDCIDLIISTVDFKLDTKISIIQVSPLLTLMDIKKIEVALNLKYIVNSNKYIHDIEQLMSIIKNHCDIRDIGSLVNDLKMNFFRMEDKKEDVIMLSDLIKEDTIGIGYMAKNWEDAVREAGMLLVKAKCAEERYIDAMIENVKTMGPYIVIAEGIAMPHARPGSGVNKVSMSLVILEKPVEFGNEDNDPVDLVFALGAIDNDSHLQVMADLITLIGNQESLNQLRQLKNKQDIIELINKVSEINMRG